MLFEITNHLLNEFRSPSHRDSASRNIGLISSHAREVRAETSESLLKNGALRVAIKSRGTFKCVCVEAHQE